MGLPAWLIRLARLGGVLHVWMPVVRTYGPRNDERDNREERDGQPNLAGLTAGVPASHDDLPVGCVVPGGAAEAALPATQRSERQAALQAWLCGPKAAGLAPRAFRSALKRSFPCGFRGLLCVRR